MGSKPVRFELPFEVLNRQWKLRILKKRKYVKKNGHGSVAITYMSKRRIDISPWGLDLETIVHELVHAYLYEMCTKSADFTVDDLEEVFAELMSKRGRELLDLGDKLVNEVSKLVAAKLITPEDT